MSDLTFRTARRRTEPITFTVEGDDYVYNFMPPKTAAMVLPMLDNAENGLMATKAAFEWLDKGLSPEDQERIFDEFQRAFVLGRVFVDFAFVAVADADFDFEQAA